MLLKAMQVISCGSALVSAAMWWRASKIDTPPAPTQADFQATSGDITPAWKKFSDSVSSQSRLNAQAATFAAIAAAAAAFAFFLAMWSSP